MARSPRILAPWVGSPDADSAIYHCFSRVVDRNHIFDEQEKEEFVRLMRRYEHFCAVQILTYCVMSNHFHLHVEVPPRPAGGICDEELYERLAAIKSEAEVAVIRRQLERCREARDDKGAEEIRERYLCRMWNLSEFMKSLKQCFTQGYNRRHKRRGTLWEERFKSGFARDAYGVRVIGAYIDLNPVRAGIAEKPEDYPWCGFGTAVAGDCVARSGIQRLMEHYKALAGGEPARRDWPTALREYREILEFDGMERRREDPSSGEVIVIRRGWSVVRRRLPDQELENVVAGPTDA